MITIQILGLDQFVVGHYSKDHTENLAQLYESDSSLINFYAPNAMIFHEGVEQTSWNTLVIVRAPKKFKPVEADVANYLMTTLSEFSINLEIEFEYFDSSVRYEKVNEAYPRFIGADEIKEADITLSNEMPDYDDEEGHHHHHHHDEDEANPDDRSDLDYNDPNQIYLGNAFENFEQKVGEAKKKAENK